MLTNDTIAPIGEVKRQQEVFFIEEETTVFQMQGERQVMLIRPLSLPALYKNTLPHVNGTHLSLLPSMALPPRITADGECSHISKPVTIMSINL